MVNISARISRSLVTVIFLSLVQVIAGPILAPQVSTSVAQATTPGIDSSNLALDVNAADATDMSTTNMNYGGSPFPTFTSTGGGYYALTPGNSQYLVPKSGVTLNANKHISVFMWVYPQGEGQLLTQLGTQTINADYHTAIIDYSSTDQMHFGLWRDVGDQSSVNGSTTIATPKNNWYYVGLVYDGTKVTAYINGVQAGQSPNFTYSHPATSYFGIGAYDVTTINQGASYGNMRFGALHVYKSALSGTQVANNFAATTGRFGPTVSNPSNASVLVNRTATFTSSACTNTTSGSATCNYGWQLSTDGGTTWNFISGATNWTYTTPLLNASYNGYRYRLYAWDPGTGSTTASDLYTITSAATLTVTTPPGSDTDSALSLDGLTQYAEISDTTGSPFDTSGTFTIQAWVNPATGCASAQTVIAKYLSYMLECYNGFWWYMNIANGSSGSDAATLIKVEQDEWHHIALTRSAGSQNLNFYYDGVLVQTLSTGVTNMTPNNQPFRIGQYNNNYFFNGQIDEVRIYNSQRTQAQIVQDMNSYGNINDSELMVYYDFNESTGSKLYNRKVGATSGSDLNILNSPLWKDVKIVDPLSLPAYTIVKFPRSYLTVNGGWRVPAGAARVSALVVAGGGGGGSRAAGGGGAGGLVYRQTLTLSVGAVESITVGHGGLGGFSMPTFTNRQGLNGGDSQLGTHTGALGGGGGGGAGDAGNTYRAGLNGGSGGGASGDVAGGGSSAAFGYGQQASSKGYGLGNDGGSGMSGTYWNGGGGGGSGGAGQNASTTSWVAGDGGAGTLDPVGGSNLCLAAGGGGGTINTGTSAGAGGSCGSGTVTAGAGTIGAVVAGSAMANSGSGGGGSGYQGTDVGGGHGGSGVIIVRWITASKPIFTQPTIDTTTAGLTDTITVSANPLNPLTRNYRWQVSSDTGTTWANASTGSGLTSNTYTTPVLETNTSGMRYQYRVIVTDSDTAGLFIIDTSVAVHIVVNPRITYTGSYSSHKYGSTHQDTFTVLNGTGNKTFTYSPNNRTGITWSSPLANTAVLTVGSTLFVGTYLETITATDTKGAQTSLAISIVVSKADTITVTAISRTETYTGSTLSFTPAFTVTGLKNSDTVTAASMSWSYNGVENSGSLYAIQSTRPTNAGTYMITPVTPSSLTDSYTAVTIVPATLTVSRATRTLTLSNIVSPLKFGEFTTFIPSLSAGSGDGTITYSTPNSESCTISAPSIRAIKSSGTCFATAVISQGFNFETATSNTVSTTLAKADTLTVTVDTLTATTYSGAPYGLTPTVTVSGLKNSNSVGASPVNFQYASIATPLTFSSTRPTDADTYTVRASGLTLATGSLTDYQGVTYVDRSLRINRALQSQLFLAEYGATFGTPYRVIVFGGSGTGAATVTTTSGTATGCSISGDTLTSISVGTCLVTAVKAQDKNFETATVTIGVYFLQFVIQQPSPVTTTGPGIGLSGATSVTLDPFQAPTISGISVSSGRVGDTVTITGAGFTASALQSVKFWRNIVAAVQGTPTNTQVVVTVPAGATSGKIIVITANGSAMTEGSFTVLP